MKVIERYVLCSGKGLEYYKGLLIRADRGLHEQVALKIRNLIPDNATILDFGCGQGALSLRMHDLGYKVIAVDTNEDDFKCNEVPFEKVDFNIPASVEAFIKKYQNHFDMVLGIESIEHVENPWNYIRVMKKLAKKSGYVLISTPNIASWISRITFLITGKFHQFSDNDLAYGHISPISKWEIENILKNEGFEEICASPGGTLPPFWIIRNFKVLMLSLMNIFLYPFMKGIKRGWCIIITAKKANKDDNSTHRILVSN